MIYPFTFIEPGKPMAPKGPLPSDRHQHIYSGHSGRIRCTLKARSPLCIPDSETIEWRDSHPIRKFFRLPDGTPSIPGSSIKGLIRSVAEAASNSCFSVFADQRFSYRLNKGLPRRWGAVVQGDQAQELPIARLSMGSDPDDPTTGPIDALGLPRENYYCCPEARLEVRIYNFWSRCPYPEVVEVRRNGRMWPNTPPQKFSCKLKQVRFGKHPKYILERIGGGRRPSEIRISAGDAGGLALGATYSVMAGYLPRQRPIWYAIEINGMPTSISRWQCGWLKTAVRGEDTTKCTHQVFIDAPGTRAIDMNASGACTSIRDEYTLAQDTPQHPNPKTLNEGQLVFVQNATPAAPSQTPAASPAAVGPVQMFKNVYQYSTMDKLRRLGEIITTDPLAFTPCNEIERVCVCCQMFGMVSGEREIAGEALAGRVRFTTARMEISPIEPRIWPLKTLRILGSPKPKYSLFYLRRQGLPAAQGGSTHDHLHPQAGYTWESNSTYLRGRKSYWHHRPHFRTEVDWLTYLTGELHDGQSIPVDQSDQNATVEISPSGTTFSFDVRFDNLSPEELGLLIFALTLDDRDPEGPRCHRIGMGKPIGMGSVKICIDHITLIDRPQRYSNLLVPGCLPDSDTTVLVDDAIQKYCQALSAQNGGIKFEQIPNIRDLLHISNVHIPGTEDPVYRPANVPIDKGFEFFTGKRQAGNWVRLPNLNGLPEPSDVH